MKNTLVLVSLAIALTACASGTAQMVRGPASDTPAAFLVLDTATGESRPVDPNLTCESPLVDPRSGRKLMMVRSENGLGDYRPDEPSYGLTGTELLRVNCSTGVTLGRVAQ